jgi:hypothetical protein
MGPGVPLSGRRTLSETTFLQLGGPSAGGGQVASSSCRRPRTALEQQILGHRGLLVSWAAPLAALQLMSGAGQRFSTWNTHSAPRSSRRGNPLRALSCIRAPFPAAPVPRVPQHPADDMPDEGRQPGHHTTPAFTRERAPRPPTPALLPWTTSRRAALLAPVHPVHRHDLGRPGAPDRRELEHGRSRNRVKGRLAWGWTKRGLGGDRRGNGRWLRAALRINADNERSGRNPSIRPAQFLVSVRSALRRTELSQRRCPCASP